MVKTLYNSLDDMIDKLQELKGKSNWKFYQNISDYYDQRDYMRSNTFPFEEDPFAVKDGGISETYQEALFLMKFLQTKPQVKSMNVNYYDLYYTVIKNRNENHIGKEDINDISDHF